MSAVSTATAPIGAAPSNPSGQVSAARGGVQLLLAAVVSIVANYLFLLGAGRVLGSADYGTLAALAGLLTVVLLPTGAVQMAVSREVSRREAVGEHAEAAAFVRGLVALGAKATVPVLVFALLLLVPVRELLRIDETAPVALALTALAGVFVFPVSLGILQGEQRFRTLAFNSAAPMVIRLVLFVGFVIAGARLYGALGAVALSAAAGTTFGLLANRRVLRLARGVSVPDLRPFLRYLVPVAVGLFGIAVLTNIDILVVKARFSAEDAGVYAAASAFARVAFFLPATILAVLFPRTAARQARGEQSTDILGRSLIVTAAFCVLLTCTYALVGAPLVDLTFGAEFAPAAGLLVPFCVAMTCFSLANVALGYHLSRNERRFAWVVMAFVVAQLGALATVPTTLEGVLWVDAVVGVSLLVAHELVMGSSFGAIRTGFRALAPASSVHRLLGWATVSRSQVVEAAIAVCGFTIVAVAATWPLVLHVSNGLPGPFPNDGSGTVGWLWQLHNDGGYRFVGATHHTLTGAPLGWDEGSALNYQWLVPYYPAFLLAGLVGEVAAFNLIGLIGLGLSGVAMYALVRYMGCGRLAAAWAGIAYLTFPWHVERLMAGHASLVHLWVFPLFVLAALAWVRRPNDVRACLTALCVLVAWMTSGYFGSIALVGLTAIAFVAFVRRCATMRPRAAVGPALKLVSMAVVAVGLVTTISVIVGGGSGIAIGRDASEIEYYGAHLRDYLPDPASPVVGDIGARFGGPSIPYYSGVENILYPGVLTVGLAAAWIWIFARQRRRIDDLGRMATLVAVTTLVTAILFSLPSPLHVGGLTVHPLPSEVLFEVLPSFRVPSRFVALGMVGLVMLGALALSHLSRRLSAAGTRWGRGSAIGLGLVACVATFAELNVLPMKVTLPGPVPSQYAAVETTRPGILVEYPLADPGSSANPEYVYWQRAHRRPLLNGASPYSGAGALRSMLVDPAAPGVARALAFLGVTSIVTRPTTYQWGSGVDSPDKASYGPGYTLVRSYDGGVRVWKVIATPAPAVAAYRTGEVELADVPRADTRQPQFVLNRQSVHVDVYAKRDGVWTLNLDVAPRQGDKRLRIEGHDETRVVRLRGRTQLRIPIRIPRGKSVLVLSFDDPVAADETGPSVSVPWFSDTQSEDALPSTLVSVDPGSRR